MQLILLLYLCSYAIAENTLVQVEKAVEVLNKSTTLNEETKRKAKKGDFLDGTDTLQNYASDEPFYPIISPNYDQYQAASSAISPPVYDKSRPNAMLNNGPQSINEFQSSFNGKQQDNIYRGPYSPIVYQQQYKQIEKTGNSGNKQENSHYTATQNTSPNRDRNNQFQAEQQNNLQTRATNVQQQQQQQQQQHKVQYVIAIPMSYVRQLLQQQQQSSQQQQHQPYYPAPVLPPQPLPASQITSTPAFTALIAQRPFHRPSQQPVNAVLSSPRSPTQGYSLPAIPIPVNAIFAATQEGSTFQPQLVYRQQAHQPQVSGPLTQYPLYQQSQSSRTPVAVYGHTSGQSPAAMVPLQLIQAQVPARYTPQSNFLRLDESVSPTHHHSNTQQVAANQYQVQQQQQLQQQQQQQQHYLPFLQYAAPVAVQRVHLEQQPQHLLSQSAEENQDSSGSSSFNRVTSSANSLSSFPTYFYPLTPSFNTQQLTYIANLPSPSNKAGPFPNFIQRPYTVNPHYLLTRANEPNASQFPQYPQSSSIHYGTHLLHPTSPPIATKAKEIVTKGTVTASNTNKPPYGINPNVLPSGVQDGLKKT